MQTGKTFTAEYLKKLDAIPMNFVIAKERSGTTLLQAMLNAHPNIVAPPESRFIILLYYRYGKIKIWTEKIITNFCNDLFKEGLFRNFWDIDKSELQTTLITSKGLLTFPLACKIVFYLSSPEKNEVHAFIDKNPVYYSFQPELHKIFPEAKYIHLIRDYRAYLVSYNRMFAGSKRAFVVKEATEIVYRWMKVNMLIEEAKSRSPENYFTLTYEFLVTNPSKSMEDVCRFLNVSYNENMVQNHQAGIYSKFLNNDKERFRKMHKNVFQPITPSLIDEWKGKILKADLINIESIAGKFGETIYGYKLTTPPKKSTNYELGIKHLNYAFVTILFRKMHINLWFYYKVKRFLWRNFK